MVRAKNSLMISGPWSDEIIMKKLILILTMGLSFAAVAGQSKKEDARKPDSTSNHHYQDVDSKKNADRNSDDYSPSAKEEWERNRAIHSGMDPRY